MIIPALHQVVDDDHWERLIGAAPERTFVVLTPSMAEHAARLFPRVPADAFHRVTREPTTEDFASLGARAAEAEVVVGLGGGRALDAAKVIAHWGRVFSTSTELAAFLRAGGRVQGKTRARLILAPSLASSGSESSRGAIVGVGAQKMGLRGPSVEPDLVVHDPRLWLSLAAGPMRHFAFDVIAHLVETTASRRRSSETLDRAREGAAELWSWWNNGQRAGEDYAAVMRAAFHAGRCLATSSTCLPHRIQYVLGPATETAHVEGIWALFPSWFEQFVSAAPSEADTVASIVGPAGTVSAQSFARVLESVHRGAGDGVRRERLQLSPERVRELAARVSGDLEADPSYSGIGSVERVLRGLSNL